MVTHLSTNPAQCTTTSLTRSKTTKPNLHSKIQQDWPDKRLIYYNYYKRNFNRSFNWIQEAQLPQRNSASAVHVYLGWLTDRAMYAQNTAESQRLYYFWHSNTLMKEVLAENAFCH